MEAQPKNQIFSKKGIVFISSLGGALEMYDFVIYIFFATIIAKLFFPAKDHVASILLTFGVFALGYLARPIGAFLFGHYGDKVGRKQGLIYTIWIMALATFVVGLLPTYYQIGVAAPIILFVLRLLQGIAVGGDLPGAITFVAEHADRFERGRFCGWVYFGVNIGILLASAIGTLLTTVLFNDQLMTWGWRLGFLFSLVLMVIGIYFRRRVAESPIYRELQIHEAVAKAPLLSLLKRVGLKNLLQAAGLVWLLAVLIAQIFLYTPSYLHAEIHISLDRALLFNTINLILFSCLIPVMGGLSDKYGRKIMLYIASICLFLLSYPAYKLMGHADPTIQLMGLFIFAVFSAMVVGTVPAVLAELFPTDFRYSAVGVTYNLSFAIFGGLTPLFVTYLIHATHNIAALAFNVIVASLVALIATVSLKDRSRMSLSSIKDD